MQLLKPFNSFFDIQHFTFKNNRFNYVLQCMMSLLLLAGKDIGTLINYLSFVLWLSCGAAVAGLLYLRKTMPNAHRPIKVSLIWPFLFLIACAFLVIFPLYGSPADTGNDKSLFARLEEKK
jgi:amino acid transporter